MKTRVCPPYIDLESNIALLPQDTTKFTGTYFKISVMKILIVSARRSWPSFGQIRHTKNFLSSVIGFGRRFKQNRTFLNILFQTYKKLRLLWFPQMLIFKQVLGGIRVTHVVIRILGFFKTYCRYFLSYSYLIPSTVQKK